MSETWYISDTHFSHAGSLRWMIDDDDPSKGLVRGDRFSSVEEMDEHMIERWNSTVSLLDKVYHLGDVAMSKKGLGVLSRLNGRKFLIKGNHDWEDLSEYVRHFEDIKGVRVKSLPGKERRKVIMQHVPCHPEQLEGRFVACVHGHYHENVVRLGKRPDLRYVSVCVEQIDYTPIHWEEVVKRIEEGT